MKKISLILAVLLALCACACAETAYDAEITAEEISGLWNVEYVTADGFMIQAEAYGITITLTLNEDGTAAMDFDGTPGEEMNWYLEDGKAFIGGYNPDENVELLLREDGVLEITDAYGSMFFTRPAEETAE